MYVPTPHASKGAKSLSKQIVELVHRARTQDRNLGRRDALEAARLAHGRLRREFGWVAGTGLNMMIAAIVSGFVAGLIVVLMRR